MFDSEEKTIFRTLMSRFSGGIPKHNMSAAFGKPGAVVRSMSGRLKSGLAMAVLSLCLTAAILSLSGCGSETEAPTMPESTPTSDTALFGYGDATKTMLYNNWFTQHVYSNMGAELDYNQWDTSHYWQNITRFNIGEDQYIMGHGRVDWNWGGVSGDWWIQKLLRTGDVGPETDSGQWQHVYPTLVGARVGGKTFVFGQNDGDNHWFVQEITSDGKMGSETDSGTWNKYYAVVVPLEMADHTYLFHITKTIELKDLSSVHFWSIDELTDKGKLENRDSGYWNNFYPTMTAFDVGGRWYLFGHRKPTLGTDGPWFIQHVTKEGKMGAETDSGKWNHYYQTVTSYKAEDGKTYLFGENTDKHWFIQEVKSGGEMGSETDNGDWNEYYSYVYPFNFDPIYLHDDDWMQALKATIGTKKLIEIALPGSHDAGMNSLDYAKDKCNLASSCNTVAQDTNIIGQLKRGSRYFDIRPVVNTDPETWDDWWTGHYDPKRESWPHWLGCRGESMRDVFADVNAFFENGAHPDELVILKMSHCYILADDQGDCDSKAFDRLVWHIENDLKNLVKCDGCNLMDMTLEEILEKGNVIALVDGVPSDKPNGIFSWNDNDLRVYDEYANKDDVSDMVSDQKGKLEDAGNHHNTLFLLSWTLTMTEKDALECEGAVSNKTILTMAAEAHGALFPNIDPWAEKGIITDTLFPNIIYIDAFDQLGTRTAIYLNLNFHKTAGLAEASWVE